MSNRNAVAGVACVLVCVAGFVVLEAADCNCEKCCTTDYCECLCNDLIKQCVSYSEPQAFNNIYSFTGGPTCGGTYRLDGQNQILTWSNHCQQCYCYDFYGQDCAGFQEGVCGAAFRLDGISGQHFCDMGG